MATYVMSDIHGCYEDFLCMLDTIGLSESDRLILAGDYIDRGKDSYRMLKWMESCPDYALLLRGNHEEEFAEYVNLMRMLDEKEGLKTDISSNKDTAALYASVRYLLAKSRISIFYFDLYGTIGRLIQYAGVSLKDLIGWAEIICGMPYYCETKAAGRDCVIVHAGYAGEGEYEGTRFPSMENFCLYARNERFLGGKRNGMVISGHTPTIIKGDFVYNQGRAFRYYDAEKDCVFYDIDCGCVFRFRDADARLACIRLEDEKIFYV